MNRSGDGGSAYSGGGGGCVTEGLCTDEDFDAMKEGYYGA